MKQPERDKLVLLDLNNPVFQNHLLNLQKSDRHSAMETLKKLRQLSWNQVYADQGLKWEKIVSLAAPPGISDLYSLRLTQSLRAVAYREGDFMRFLSIPPDHDATYGKK